VVVQNNSPTWSDVKAKLADFDRASLQGLVKDLYGVSKDNQAFLHARFGLGSDVLKPYKTRMDRWLWPDVLKNQDVSTSKAKRVIADYKKAIGQPGGLAELMVFYCERASGFSNAFGFADEAYFNALVKMFEQVLESLATLPTDQRDALLDRLGDVRIISHNFGYGVGDEMDTLLVEYKDDA
jgi:hypothetical protein